MGGGADVTAALVSSAEALERAGDACGAAAAFSAAASELEATGAVAAAASCRSRALALKSLPLAQDVSVPRAIQAAESYPAPNASGTSPLLLSAAFGAGVGLVGGAFIGHALLGMATGGLLGATLSMRDDSYGDAVRTGGCAVDRTVQRARQFDDRYLVSSQARAAAVDYATRAARFEAEHDLRGRVRRSADATIEAAHQLNERHSIATRLSNAAAAATDTLHRAMEGTAASSGGEGKSE